MELYNLIALLIVLVAGFDFLNYHTLKLPRTIGLLVFSLLFSVILVATGKVEPGVSAYVGRILSEVDFNEVLMHGMLSFLLFAGALHVDLEDLRQQGRVIGITATLGVLISTALVAGLSFGCFQLLGLEVSFIYCLLFGALVSPTDPIAVLSILKSANVPEGLQTKIAGESLFNDGIGVVVFTVLLSLLGSQDGISAPLVLTIFAEEALGGLLFGFLLGYVSYRMLKTIDEHNIEVFITLALVTGGYALATAIHVSGPLAVVVAGILIGNTGRQFGMSQLTRKRLDTFWEMVDEMLNAILFVLIGLEVLVIGFDLRLVGAGLTAILIVLGSRFLSTGLIVHTLRAFRTFTPHAVKIMTWAGVRGGISVALVLSLPPGPEREVLLSVTYLVVVFSIAVQGLTLKPLVRRLIA